MSEIVDLTESMRAKAVGARHAFLVREFALEARKAGLTVHTTLDRMLTISGHGGEEILAQPAIGVPDAEAYESLQDFHERAASKGRPYGVPAVLLYDQTGIRARWLKHLSWLNVNLSRVQSVRLIEAERWLAALRGTKSS